MFHIERFCISTVCIIRMSFSASNNLYYIILSLLWLSRVCVCVKVGGSWKFKLGAARARKGSLVGG